MARVVKGRSPYAQGTSKYEAFRPDQREYGQRDSREGFDRLLQLMARAEAIGKSPLGGLAINILGSVAKEVQARKEAPSIQEAAVARAKAAGAAIPTPEEQGRAAGEAQADQFIQEAMKQPAPAIAELTPAKMTVRRAPPRPTLQQEDLALKAQENLARQQRQAQLRARSAALTAQIETKRALLERMEALQPKFRVRLRQAIRGQGLSINDILTNIRERHASLPSGVSPAEEEYYDVLADYLRLQKGVNVPDIDADVARAAREVVVPVPQVQAEREQVVRLRAEADARQKELDENRNLMNEAGIQKNEQDIQNLREQAQDIENKMARRGLSEMDALAQVPEAEMAQRMRALEEPEPGMTPQQMRQQRAQEGARSREMATQALGEGAVPAGGGEPTGFAVRPPKPLDIASLVDGIMGATKTAEAEAKAVVEGGTEMDALAKDAGVAGQMAKLAETEAQMDAEEAKVTKEEDEFMKRARAGEKSLQTQREEAERKAYTETLNKVVGPNARPEQAKSFTDLLARARTATTGEAQAELIRQTENISLPARSIFDAMFGGPQQRARAELIKFFPKPQRPVRQRSASQIEADRALAEMRRAQAERTRGLTKFYDPARVEKLDAATKKALEVADAREQGYSITESRIKKNLAQAAAAGKRRARGGRYTTRQRNSDIEAAARAERAEINSSAGADVRTIDSQKGKLQTELSRLNSQKVGNVPDPGAAPRPPGAGALRREKAAYEKRKAAYDKRKARYDEDREALKQRNDRKTDVEGKIKTLNERRAKRLRIRDKELKAVNDEAYRLKGGQSARLRAGAAARRKKARKDAAAEAAKEAAKKPAQAKKTEEAKKDVEAAQLGKK